jgi:hypothetical protein
MCVAIVLTAMILGMAVTLIASLLRWNQGMNERAVARAEINRLTDTLRRDLRITRNIQPSGDSTLLLETAGGPPIVYTLDGERCRRSRDASAYRLVEHDSFRIGPTTAWQFEQLATPGQPAFNTVDIQLAPRQEQETPPPPIRVVGRGV